MFAGIFGPSSSSTMAVMYGTSWANAGCGGAWTMANVNSVALPDARSHSSDAPGDMVLMPRG